MLRESEVKKLYYEAVNRAAENKRDKNLYYAYLYTAITIGKILEIDTEKTLNGVKNVVNANE